MVCLPNFKSKITYLIVGGMVIGAALFGLKSFIFRESKPPQDSDSQAAIVIHENKLGTGLLEEARKNERVLIIVALSQAWPFGLEVTPENYQHINTERQDAVLGSLVTGKFEVIRRWSVAMGFAGYADLQAILEFQAHPLVSSITLNIIFQGSGDITQEISGDTYD